MKLVEINDMTYKNAISEGNCFVLFYADWCVFCNRFKPIFEKASETDYATARYYQINVDMCPQAADEFDVLSLPTVIVFDNGREVERITGAVSIEKLHSVSRRYDKD